MCSSLLRTFSKQSSFLQVFVMIRLVILPLLNGCLKIAAIFHFFRVFQSCFQCIGDNKNWVSDCDSAENCKHIKLLASSVPYFRGLLFAHHWNSEWSFISYLNIYRAVVDCCKVFPAKTSLKTSKLDVSKDSTGAALEICSAPHKRTAITVYEIIFVKN